MRLNGMSGDATGLIHYVHLADIQHGDELVLNGVTYLGAVFQAVALCRNDALFHFHRDHNGTVVVSEVKLPAGLRIDTLGAKVDSCLASAKKTE